MRLMRWELQAALPPKWSTASRTDLKGAEVSTSTLPSRPPAAVGGARSCASSSPSMGTRAWSKADDVSRLFGFCGVLPGDDGVGEREPKESKPVEHGGARIGFIAMGWDC